MSKQLVRDLLALVNAGWRPYTAEPQTSAYESLKCDSPKKAYWFCKGDLFLCLGCSRRCSLNRPAGFVPPLPIKYDIKKCEFTLTPQEIVTRKPLLTAKEAAYCLNVSISQIYAYIAEGKLIALNGRPRRVKSEDVKSLMHDFDE